MTYYYHKDENVLYVLTCPMRETSFNLLKKANPERIVMIKNVETKEEKHVFVKDLINYSIVRNTTALRPYR